MKGILLPVKKVWTDMIYAGDKRYELRKNEPRDREFLAQPERPIYLYEVGVGFVTGMCSFEAATRCAKAEEAGFYAKVSPGWVLKYGTGRDGMYHLWRISDAARFSTPLPISMFGLRRVPQSWCYVEVGERAGPFERGERMI